MWSVVPIQNISSPMYFIFHCLSQYLPSRLLHSLSSTSRSSGKEICRRVLHDSFCSQHMRRKSDTLRPATLDSHELDPSQHARVMTADFSHSIDTNASFSSSALYRVALTRQASESTIPPASRAHTPRVHGSCDHRSPNPLM